MSRRDTSRGRATGPGRPFARTDRIGELVRELVAEELERIADELGVDYFAANELEVVEGKLTGRILGDVVDRAGKADALRRFADEARIPVRNTCLLYTSDAADDLLCVDRGGRRIFKKKTTK